MRIVAGSFGGRKLHSVKGAPIRPTADRVREAIFSIIAAEVPGAEVLDLFAGTGALGLEALSRGASSAVFVDQTRQAVRIIAANARICGVEDRIRIIHGSVLQSVRRLAAEGCRFSLIFMDPPYGKGFIESTLGILHEVADDEALLVAEHHLKDHLPSTWETWVKTQVHRYGTTVVSIFLKESS